MKIKNIFPFIPWLCVALLYTPLFYVLYKTRWEMADYTHAYFILPIALFIVWKRLREDRGETRDEGRMTKDEGRGKRGAVSSIIHHPSEQSERSSISCNGAAVIHHPSSERSGLPSVAVFLFGILLFIFGSRAEYLVISTFSFIVVMLGMTMFLYGAYIVRLLWFPFTYLLFIVPPPRGMLDALTVPMRYFASFAAHKLLALMQYPITRDGLFLYMGGNDIYMGEACSGFRSLITLLALGSVYIYMSKSSTKTKLVMFACLAPFAIVGNIVRVMSTCLITYHIGKKYAEGFYHELGGVLMFVILILCLMGIEAMGKGRRDVGCGG